MGTGALPWVALAILIGGLILILIVMVRMVIMTISKLCNGDSIIMPMKCFSQTGGRGCYTVNQDKCVFPFQYKGQKFTQCTTVGPHSNHTSIYKNKSVQKRKLSNGAQVDNNGKPWCSIRTDHQVTLSHNLLTIFRTALDGKDRRINGEFGTLVSELFMKSLLHPPWGGRAST